MQNTLIDKLHKNNNQSTLFGRYITLNVINPLLDKLPSKFKTKVIGQSVLGNDIVSVTIGSGAKKVLIWSQMHGNESTTTKAIMDVLYAFNDENLDHILKSCTIKIIPILNPDGAEAYTRLNANKIDLNRDAQDVSQPESKALRDCFDAFKPDFCFNMHGQRTMYSVGKTSNTATLSFLSPSEDPERRLTSTRKIAMEIISVINRKLQTDLPGQIGRYDDGFNINCVGDTFQTLKVPTILFEAGHYKDDYSREVVRRFVFKSLLVALDYISDKAIIGSNYKYYFEIPENDKLFYDIIIRQVQIDNQILDIGINYEEKLVNHKVEFTPKIIAIENLSGFFGHQEYDANKSEVLTSNKKAIYVDYANDFVLVNNVKLSLNL